MAEISKPDKRTFWKATKSGYEYSGFNDIDQVTTVPDCYTFVSDTTAGDLYPALPSSGTVTEGEIYSYDGGMVIVRQTHVRTIYAPEDTPALFSVYRANTEGEQWVANEAVQKGDTRTYNGKTYQCLQSHTTQSDWTPDKTATLWQEVVGAPSTGEWATGVAYKVGDEVMYLSHKYRCRQAHTSISTWNPVAAASLWLLIE